MGKAYINYRITLGEANYASLESQRRKKEKEKAYLKT